VIRIAPTPAPTPIPAFAPVDKDKPAEVDEEGLGTEAWAPGEVCDASEGVVAAVIDRCEAEESVVEAVAVGLEVDIPV
jgi:hypothetical protein